MEFCLFSKPHIAHAQHTHAHCAAPESHNDTQIQPLPINFRSSLARLTEDLSETTFYFIRLDFSFGPQTASAPASKNTFNARLKCTTVKCPTFISQLNWKNTTFVTCHLPVYYSLKVWITCSADIDV